MAQFIYIGLVLLGLGFKMAKHGTPKDEEHNFWGSLISEAILCALLAWGGFFDNL